MTEIIAAEPHPTEPNRLCMLCSFPGCAGQWLRMDAMNVHAIGPWTAGDHWMFLCKLCFNIPVPFAAHSFQINTMCYAANAILAVLDEGRGDDVRAALLAKLDGLTNVEALRGALIVHRADLHSGSTRPCSTCQQSARALGIEHLVPNGCARSDTDREALSTQ